MKRRRRGFVFGRSLTRTNAFRRRSRKRLKGNASALERIEVCECRTLLSATPTVTAIVTGSVYNGTPHGATAEAQGTDGSQISGTFSLTYYNGSTVNGPGTTNPPVNAGTYTVVAAFTSADPNYTNGQSAPATYTIEQDYINVNVTDTGGVYNGQPFPAAVSATGVTTNAQVSGTATVTYYIGGASWDPSTTTPPTEAGTYLAEAQFTSSDPNYVSDGGGTTFTISQATPSVSVTDPGGTYNGSPFAPTTTVTGANNTPVSSPQAVNYSTFLGGSGVDRAINIATDSSGNTFVTGWTTSANFPTTPGTYETTSPSVADGYRAGFVAKFDPNGNLLWSTYIDGAGFSIAVDSSDNVYVGGAAGSSFLPTPGAYQVTDNSTGGTIGFVAKLNANGSALVWATYLGGTDFGEVDGIAVDGSGNVYVAGDTTATDFPTLNAIQSANAGGSDAFISELNSTGSALVFSTYLGGSGDEYPSAITLDPAGNIYINGSTDSTDLPTTTNAFQTAYGGGDSDAFVAKLSPGGSQLVYLTYLGGSGDDYSSDVEMAVDANGDAYVTGYTDSSDFPTLNAYQNALNGGEDAYVTELNPLGTALVNSTYFGGSNETGGSGIALDSAGNVYIAGQTDSTDLPTANPVASSGDFYVAELNLSTSTLVNSTYFGGSNDEGLINPVAVDSTGHAVVTGDTASSSFPTTPNAFQSTYGGGVRDAFVTSIGPGTPTLTYYAGTTATGTPLSEAPTDAGTYTVVATFAGDNDYTTATGSATFTINPATPSITLSDASTIFNGSPFSTTGSATGAGGVTVSGSFTFTYYPGNYTDVPALPSAPSAPGIYTVIASFTSSDPDYLNADARGSFGIFQAAPVFTVGDAGGTYDGSPFPGTGTVAGVVAGVDDTPGSSLEGVDMTLLYYSGTNFGGTPLPGAPTIAGSYAVEAYFPGSQDYTAGGRAYFFVISQARPILTASDAGGVYDGNPVPGTGTVAGVVSGVDDTPGGSLEGVDMTLVYYTSADFGGTPLSGAPTDAGSYLVESYFPGSQDYTAGGEVSAFAISQATPSLTVSDAGGPYDGQPYAANATATGIGGATVNGSFAFTYYVGASVNGQGSATPPTAAGTYTVTAAFTSADPDYVNTNGGPVTFSISSSDPTITAPAALSLNEGGSLTFSNANAISVADSAASGTSESLTLSVTNGTLKFGSISGLKVTSGSNNSPSLTVKGTLANLNAALQTLKFTPTSGYFGPASLSLTASDSGNNSTGSATVVLTVNGPPTVTAPTSAGVDENGSLVFVNGTAITLADAAASTTSDSLMLTVTHGTLSLGSIAGLTFSAGSNGSASMTFSGTLANLNAALGGLTFIPKSGYTGSASLAVTLKDSASGLKGAATVALTVSIPASQPTATVGTDVPTSVPGEPVPLVINVTDTNAAAEAANFTLAITFGDGKSAKVSSASSLIVNHVYAKTGTFTVSVTATDEFGHVSAAGTTSINVVSAAVETDPFNPGLTALFVGGTTGKDTVNFAASGSQIAVTLNKVAEGTFSTNGPLIVFGQGGTDTITKGAGVTDTSYLLETPTDNNAETDLDDEAIQWAGLSSAVEILNE